MRDGAFQLEAGAVNQPRTLFKPGSWLAKIDFINHLILFNNVLITVLSEKEGGKTSFGALLQTNLDQQIKSIFLTAKAPCDSHSLINDIATQLHLNCDSETTLLSIVDQINERKAHVLLVIDDAQNVPESIIKDALIAIKNQEDFGFFHLCLISDYSVVATLNNLAADQFNNLVHSIELGPLNESETRTYVLQRAMTARLINRPLSDAQFKQFHQLTKGNLAKINSSLEPFIFKCLSQKKTNNLVLLKRSVMALSAVVVGGISYLYYDYAVTTSSSSSLMRTASFAHGLAEKQPAPARLAQERPLVSEIASWQDSSVRQLVHFALPKKQILDETVDEDQNLNTVALVDKVVVIPTVKSAKEGIPHHEAVVAVNQPNTNESSIASISGFSKNKVTNKAVVKKTSANRYTIQLVASHNVADVHRFRKNNHLMDGTKIRHFSNAKGKWYILTIGEYDNRSNAQNKANHLPADLAKLKPWIRPVSGLSEIG